MSQEASNAAPARCSLLCGAVRAYGKRALDPSWWWKHENQCPMREHLRKEQRAKLDS